MKLVAIESPFAAREPFTVEDHVAYAKMAMADCLRRGEAPIASHLLYPQVLDDLKPAERTLGIEAGLAWSVKADLAVFYVDLGFSGGMSVAMRRYNALGISVEQRFLFNITTRELLNNGSLPLRIT